jgi:hypothetical protein
VKVPIITLIPPANGPNMMPKSGARLSESEKDADNPIIGPIGINLKIAKRAEKIATSVSCFVVTFSFKTHASVEFFASLCIFLHSLIKLSKRERLLLFTWRLQGLKLGMLPHEAKGFPLGKGAVI